MVQYSLMLDSQSMRKPHIPWVSLMTLSCRHSSGTESTVEKREMFGIRFAQTMFYTILMYHMISNVEQREPCDSQDHTDWAYSGLDTNIPSLFLGKSQVLRNWKLLQGHRPSPRLALPSLPLGKDIELSFFCSFIGSSDKVLDKSHSLNTLHLKSTQI